MAKSIKTHIFCFDDFRSFSEDVKKRFSDTTRYKVISFKTRQEFLKHLEGEKEDTFCKVAILGMHDTREQLEIIDHLTVEIKKIDPTTGVILLIPEEKMDEVKKAIVFNIDAYIPQNTNAILRIHNMVKNLISEHNIIRFRKRKNVSLTFLIAFIILSLLFIVIAWFKLPEYF